LSLLDVAHTVAGATPPVVAAADVVCPRSALVVAVSTRSCHQSCTTSDDALLKWTLAKRNLIVQKYGTANINASAHAALMSDISHVDPSPPAALDVPTLEECTDFYDDT
jgi:hypothetical protein